jgi:hypothetical protein
MHDNRELNRLRRKENQAWECAGLARRDGDLKDAERWTNEAREWARKIKEWRDANA